MKDGKKRCAWGDRSDLLRHYHDEEWGVPVHDDRKHFEHLLMESMHCGLSWELMLKKREIFRACFADFDPEKVARFGDADVERILACPGMIRSERKVRAVIGNAAHFLAVREEFGSFDRYIWSFTGGKIYVYKTLLHGQPQTASPLSDEISADLKKRGFRYLGSITVYSFLQACGILLEHDPDCFRFQELLDGADAEVRLMNTVYLEEAPGHAWECEYSCGAVLFTRTGGEIRYLLTQSRKGPYGLPKGHRMAGEEKEEAALREILEETGIRARILPGKQWKEIRAVDKNDRAVKKITYFLADYADQEIRVQEEELLSCALVPFEEAMRLPLQTARVAEILADADAYLRFVRG